MMQRKIPLTIDARISSLWTGFYYVRDRLLKALYFRLIPLNLLILFQYLPHCIFVVECFQAAWLGTLKQFIISLCVKKKFFIDFRFLKAVVYIRCDHKIIFVFVLRLHIVNKCIMFIS